MNLQAYREKIHQIVDLALEMEKYEEPIEEKPYVSIGIGNGSVPLSMVGRKTGRYGFDKNIMVFFSEDRDETNQKLDEMIAVLKEYLKKEKEDGRN